MHVQGNRPVPEVSVKQVPLLRQVSSLLFHSNECGGMIVVQCCPDEMHGMGGPRASSARSEVVRLQLGRLELMTGRNQPTDVLVERPKQRLEQRQPNMVPKQPVEPTTVLDCIGPRKKPLICDERCCDTLVLGGNSPAMDGP